MRSHNRIVKTRVTVYFVDGCHNDEGLYNGKMPVSLDSLPIWQTSLDCDYIPILYDFNYLIYSILYSK